MDDMTPLGKEALNWAKGKQVEGESVLRIVGSICEAMLAIVPEDSPVRLAVLEIPYARLAKVLGRDASAMEQIRPTHGSRQDDEERRYGSYAWEKLYHAIRMLATVDRDLRTRLEVAWRNCLSGSFSDKHWPSEQTHIKFLDLRDEMTPGRPLPEHLASLSDHEVSELAKRIVSLFEAVCREIYAS